MKTRLITLIAMVGLICLSVVGRATAAGDLYIYTWGEYTPPELVEKFTD